MNSFGLTFKRNAKQLVSFWGPSMLTWHIIFNKKKIIVWFFSLCKFMKGQTSDETPIKRKRKKKKKKTIWFLIITVWIEERRSSAYLILRICFSFNGKLFRWFLEWYLSQNIFVTLWLLPCSAVIEWAYGNYE
jgi:hypothetical protein